MFVVDHVLDILKQPFEGIPGSQPHFPQITDLSQVTSEAVQGGGDVIQLEPAAVNLAPTVTFVNGKHEVLCLLILSIMNSLAFESCFMLRSQIFTADQLLCHYNKILQYSALLFS